MKKTSLALFLAIFSTSAMGFVVSPDISRSKNFRTVGPISAAWENDRKNLGAVGALRSEGSKYYTSGYQDDYFVGGPQFIYSNEQFNFQSNYRIHDTDGYNYVDSSSTQRKDVYEIDVMGGYKILPSLVFGASVQYANETTEKYINDYSGFNTEWTQSRSEIETSIVSAGLGLNLGSNFFIGATAGLIDIQSEFFKSGSDINSTSNFSRIEGNIFQVGAAFINDAKDAKVELSVLTNEEVESDNLFISLTGDFKLGIIELLPTVYHLSDSESFAFSIDADTSITNNIFLRPGASYSTARSGAGHIAFGYRQSLVDAELDVAREFESEDMLYSANLRYNF
jgi:hypothetical protein